MLILHYLWQTKFQGKLNPRAQRRALVRALADYAQAYQRDEAIAIAYLSGQHTMAAIADYFGVHYTTVSRLVKNYEEK
jgi:putative transposase